MNPKIVNPDCSPETHPFTTCWKDFNQGHISPDAEAAWVVNQGKGYFGFLPNPQIKHLIVGSFPIWASVHHDPPHADFDFSFFYCSRLNGFYKILGAVSGYEFFLGALTPYQMVQSVADFFTKKDLGITDIIWKVKRTDVKCRSASDKKLKVVAFNQLCQLLSDYPEITNVYFTSIEVGNWYREHMRKCSLDRTVNEHDLFSPSPASDRPASGNLNKDARQYGDENSIEFHTLQIPMQNDLSRTDRYKVVKWAKRLRNVPGLVRPEILEHPNFIAIEARL